MKRRDFLTAGAILSLLVSAPVQAAKKAVAKKAPAKAPAKTSKTTKSSAKSSAQTKKGTKPERVESPADDGPTEAPSESRDTLNLPDEPAAQWRTYDLRSNIALTGVKGKVRLWLPLVQYKDTSWARSLGHSWQGNFTNAGIYRDPVAEMEVFYADWGEGTSNPQLQIISQVATQDRTFDVTRRNGLMERPEVLRRCLHSSDLVPTDGIVRRTAERAIGRVKDPLAQAKALYDWVVDNTNYDSQAKRVGGLNIGNMIEDGSLSGQSGDISLLFVALCRSVGIPARPVYGLRLDRSRLFGSLGANGELNAAQHCRAEFYTPGYGWIGVDPADVRKAVREEHLTTGDSKLAVLKKLLFGFWEMNWIGFNAAQDVSLRGSTGKPRPFLLYPEVETADGRFDSQDTNRMSYSVTATRVEG